MSQNSPLRTRLKYWRTRRNFSQLSLQKASGVSSQTIYRIEKTGDPPRSTEVVEKLCKALKITTDDFFTEDEKYADGRETASAA